MTASFLKQDPNTRKVKKLKIKHSICNSETQYVNFRGKPIFQFLKLQNNT